MNWITKSATLGWLALGVAGISVIAGPPGWIAVIGAALSTALLARGPQFGWLGAGLVVTLAIPFGRGADVLQLTIAGVPVRPADAVIIVAILGALLHTPLSAVRSLAPARTVLVVGAGLILASGVVALAVGIADDHSLRDVARDVRFWALYGVAIIALITSTSHRAIVRALLAGSTVFAVLVIASAVLPPIDGGLKDQVLSYDRGTLRMQFGNSAFLLPAVAYTGAILLRRPTVAGAAAWLYLLMAALVLSLTRISILASLLVLILVAAVFALPAWRSRWARSARRIGIGAAVVVLAVASALGVAAWAQAPGAGSIGEDQLPENVFDRIIGRSDRSDLDAILTSRTGRMSTYLSAYGIIMEHFPFGAGLGQLVPTAYAYSEARAETIGLSPGVDNAYLTFGVKAGVTGIALIGAFFVLPLWTSIRSPRRGLRAWYLPAWIGVLTLTFTQAFASSGYGPYALALLAVVPALAVTARRAGRRGGSDVMSKDVDNAT